MGDRLRESLSISIAWISQRYGVLAGGHSNLWPPHLPLIKTISSKRLRLALTLTIAVFILFFTPRLFIELGYPLGSLEHIPLWSAAPPHSEVVAAQEIEWSQYAYVQYVTNSDYLCNSVMLFEILSRLGSRADRLMMYPSYMLAPDASDGDSSDAHLLIKARDEYNVRLQPIEVQHKDGLDETWGDSFTKLLAFNQTDYTRVLSLDSDATILQPMDELFLLPPCQVAMPRAYWLYPDKQILASHVMLVQPSAVEFDRIVAEVKRAGSNEYDMEILNKLYKDQALILPHRRYGILTSEFRAQEHERYLGSEMEKWDPVAIFNEAKFLHFSDWPVPKPWIQTPNFIREEHQPKCHEVDGVESCVERELWNGFYRDFSERRKVCEEPVQCGDTYQVWLTGNLADLHAKMIIKTWSVHRNLNPATILQFAST